MSDSEDRIALVASAVVLIAALGCLAMFLARESVFRTNGERPADFAQYYVTSWRLRMGEPVYTPLRTDGALQDRLGWSYSDVRTGNPPPVILAMLPVSFVSYRAAWWSMVIVSILSVAIGTAVAAHASGYGPAVSAILGAASLCSLPMLVLLALNHFESILVPLSVLGWLSLRRERARKAGVVWGVAASLKLFPALWLAALSAPHRRAGATAGVVASALIIVASFAVVGIGDLKTFFESVLPQSHLWSESPGNFSLVSLVAELFPRAAARGVFLVVGALLLYGIWRVRDSADGAWIRSVSASLLLSPLSWSYYLVLTIPCLVALSSSIDLDARRERLPFFALVFGLLFWPSLFGNWASVPFFERPIIGPLIERVPTFGLIGLYLAAEKLKPVVPSSP